MGKFKLSIKLLKSLDYNLKRNFILTLNSEVGFLQTPTNILIEIKKPATLSTKFSSPVYSLIVPIDLSVVMILS
jgi:hypothetical protein